MADITDLLGLGAPGGGVFNIEPQQSPLASYLGASNIPTPEQPHHSKLRNTLGAIGDAMLVATGHAPIYRQRMEQEQQNQALQGFLQNPDEAIQRLMQVDPRAGIALYTQMHSKQADPETIQLLKAAGIDPASEQGKQIIQSKLSGGTGADPSSVREYQFAKGQGFGGSYMDFINQRGGPLVANNGDGTFTIVPRAMVPTGGAGAPVTATGPDGKKVQYDPATHSWQPIGGQTPTASGNFPGR